VSRAWFLSSLLVVLLLFSGVSLAASDLAVAPIKNEITLAQHASFLLTITNHAKEKQRYSIYSLQNGQGWSVDSAPLKDKIVEINPGKNYSTTIIARPLDTFPPGIYFIRISVESDLGEKYEESLKIYLSPEKPLDYLPSIKATVDMDDKVDPQQAVAIKLFLENRNPLNLSNLKVTVQGDIPNEFRKEAFLDIGPLSSKTVELTVTPYRFQQPKKYTLLFIFEREGETVKIVEKNIEIIPLTPPFTVEKNSQAIYLKVFNQLTVTNGGNVENTQEVRIPVTFWQALLSNANGKSVEGQRYLVWESTLGPNESGTIFYTTNYRLILYVLALLAFLAVFYFYIRSPVMITKHASTVRGNDEASLSEIKLTLEVKNLTGLPLRDVEVVDVVPAIVNVEKSLELGTLKPHEIKHTQHGTRVMWSIPELEGHEHRLITYKVKAKLNILGMVSLPRATVRYIRKGGRKGKAYSNIFRLR